MYLYSPLSSLHFYISDIFPTLEVQRYFTGYGQEFGGIAVHLTNTGNTPLNITYYEVLPWFLRVYFHTFHITTHPLLSQNEEESELQAGKDKNNNNNNGNIDVPNSQYQHRYIPAESRYTPSVIEISSLLLPPRTITTFTVHFEKAFLHYTEHPPDANRGFDIGSAIVTVHLNGSFNQGRNGLEWSPVLYPSSSSSGKGSSTNTMRIYTEGLLVSLPTPDFSKSTPNIM